MKDAPFFHNSNSKNIYNNEKTNFVHSIFGVNMTQFLNIGAKMKKHQNSGENFSSICVFFFSFSFHLLKYSTKRRRQCRKSLLTVTVSLLSLLYEIKSLEILLFPIFPCCTRKYQAILTYSSLLSLNLSSGCLDSEKEKKN